MAKLKVCNHYLEDLFIIVGINIVIKEMVIAVLPFNISIITHIKIASINDMNIIEIIKLNNFGFIRITPFLNIFLPYIYIMYNFKKLRLSPQMGRYYFLRKKKKPPVGGKYFFFIFSCSVDH